MPCAFVFVPRFHNVADEKVIGHDILTPICGDIQLSVDEYRTKLYDVSQWFLACDCIYAKHTLAVEILSICQMCVLW